MDTPSPSDSGPQASATESDRQSAEFDVFLSYSSADRAYVERLAQALRDEGLAVWLDSEQIVAGERFQDAIGEGIAASGSVAVVIGGGDTARWVREEVHVAIDRAVTASDGRFRVFLVLLPEAPDPFRPTDLSPFLAQRSWVDLRRTTEPRLAAHLVARAALGLAPNDGLTVSESDICPYVGLRPFGKDDSHLFFGRDADVQRVTEQIANNHVVAIMGRSGSGKSSLLHTGVLVDIDAGRTIPGSNTWQVSSLRPGRAPLDRLVRAVSELRPELNVTDLAEDLRSDPATLNRLTHSDDRPVLWVVDQAEELFTLCDSAADREAFAQNLVAASHYGSARIVFALRSDFYHRFAELRDLGPKMAAAQHVVAAMSPNQLADAIVQPARLVGLNLADGLAARIIEDLGTEPGALPLLQYALLQLWEQRQGNYLTHSAYADIGGVGAALSTHAEEAIEALSEQDSIAAQRLLVSLVALGDSGQETRRPAQLAEVASEDIPLRRLEAVAGRLADQRLITTRGELGQPGTEVELAHDGLIAAWPTLQRWLADGRETELARRHIRQDAMRWEDDEREPDWLYRGVELESARRRFGDDPADLPHLETEFLRLAVSAHEERLREEDDRQRRQRRAQRRLLATGAIALVILAAATATALVFQRQASNRADEAEQFQQQAMGQAEEARVFEQEARHQAEEARAQTRAALRLSLEAEALQLADENPALALALAIEAWGPTTDEWKISPAYTRAATTFLTKEWFERELIAAHDGAIDALAFSDDGQLLASVGGGGVGGVGNVKVWDTATGVQVGPTIAPTSSPSWLRFSPDGETLATNGSIFIAPSADCTGESAVWHCFALWDVSTGQQIGQSNLVAKQHLEFSPDGSQILAIGRRQQPTLWDVATATQVGAEFGLGWAHAAAFSADGREVLVIADSTGATLQKWDVAERKLAGRTLPLGDIVQPNVAGSTVAFSGSRELLALARRDGSIDVVSTKDGEPIGPALRLTPDQERPEGQEGPGEEGEDGANVSFPLDLTFNELETKVTAAYRDVGVATWDLTTADHDVTVVPIGNDQVLGAAVPSPDGSTVAMSLGVDIREGFSGNFSYFTSVGIGGSAEELRSTTTGAVIPGPISGRPFTFSTDGATLAGGTNSGNLRLWESATPTHVRVPYRVPGAGAATLRVIDGEAGTVPLLLTSARRAAADTTFPVSLWDPAGGQELARFIGHTDRVTSAALSPDRGIAATTSADGSTRLWRVETAEQIGLPIVFDGTPDDVWFSPDGKTIAVTASNSPVVQLWNTESGRSVGQPLDHDGAAVSALFTADGTQIVTLAWVDGEDSLQFWDAQTGRSLLAIDEPPLGVGKNIQIMEIDGDRLIMGGIDGPVSIWDTTTRSPVARVATGHINAIWAAVLSPDREVLATGGTDQSIRLWDAQTLEPVGQPMRGNERQTLDLDFTADGSILVSAGADRTVRLWDIKTQTQIGDPLLGHEQAVRHVRFLPDGQTIVSVDEGGTIRYWDSMLWDHQRACATLSEVISVDDIADYLPDGIEPQGCSEFGGPAQPENGARIEVTPPPTSSPNPSAVPTPPDESSTQEPPPTPTMIAEDRGRAGSPLPVPGTAFDAETPEGSVWSIEAQSLVEVDLREGATEEGTCLLLVGMATPQVLARGVTSGSVSVPFGLTVDGEYLADTSSTCETVSAEEAGYEWILDDHADVTAGTSYPFFTQFLIPLGSEAQAVVVGPPGYGDQTYLTARVLSEIPEPPAATVASFDHDTLPLVGATVTVEAGFSKVAWFIELDGLVEVERRDDAESEGSCLALIGTMMPTASTRPVPNLLSQPRFGTIIDGRSEATRPLLCGVVDDIEAAGYGNAFTAGAVTTGTTFPFFETFFVEEGATLEAVVVGSTFTDDAVLLTPDRVESIPRRAVIPSENFDGFVEPLTGAAISLERFGSPWEIEILGLVERDALPSNEREGSCLALLGHAAPISEADDVEPNDWWRPAFGVISTGQFRFAEEGICDTVDIEAAGYQSAETTTDQAFDFYAELFVPAGQEPEVIVVDSLAGASNEVYLAAEVTPRIPESG